MRSFDELWRGGPRFMQTQDCFKLSTDSVLLADFVNMDHVRNCLDLGSGTGVLTILLAVKNPKAELMGVEIQTEFAKLSRMNIEENEMEQRARILTADLREYRSLFPSGSFDLVVTNPPYFADNSGYTAPCEHRAISRDERSCTLPDVCAAARWALRWGGSLTMVHRPERLSEIFCAMTGAGIEPKRLRFVSHSADKAPSLVLLEGRRGGSRGLTVEKPLFMTDSSGGDSLEVRKIYHRGEFAPQDQEK